MADKRCICDDDQRGTAASPLKIRLPFSTRGEQEVNKKERQVEDIFFSFSLLQLVTANPSENLTNFFSFSIFFASFYRLFTIS